MKKKKNNNTGVIIITIIIIILGLLGAYLWESSSSTNQNTTNKEGVNTTTKNFDETEEREALSQNIEEIKTSLGFITILTSIDKYNAGGDYVTKKDINLLETPQEKQLFIMEQILKNKENDKNFIILDMNGEIDKETTSPTTEGSTAYYPTNLFKQEYEKYFKDTFSLEKRQVSTFNNKYDQDSNYIYYNNRRPGLNGLSVTGITIDKIEKNTEDNFKADINIHYNERTSSMLGVSSEEASLIYKRNGETIQIETFKLK